MNLQSLQRTETFEEAIRCLSKNDIDIFFQSYENAELQKMRTPLTERELTDINARVTLLSEVRDILKQIATVPK